jgi:AraC family transcriptional regulator
MKISDPRIIQTAPIELVGYAQTMSLLDMPIAQLWQKFRTHPLVRTREIPVFYAVQHYHEPLELARFSPAALFEKWVMAPRDAFDSVPTDMVELLVQSGLYAQFEVTAPPTAAKEVFGYIYGEWLPKSGYALDHRPQVEVIPHDYIQKGEQGSETIWIPIVR